MSLFDLYGIKEVADVTFWDTKTGAPVLYLDTLKVSTIEETGEQSEARGGKGNAPLIIWDYGKEITLTLEDALFSMKSMQIMHNPNDAEHAVGSVSSVVRTSKFTTAPATDSNTTVSIPEWAANLNATFYDEQGVSASDSLAAGKTYIASWTQSVQGEVINISSNSFPGTYRITGDTYARNQATGEDEFFQFVVQLAKINPEQTITMQADGDPSTFSMTVRVLRPADGKMMQLIKYS